MTTTTTTTTTTRYPSDLTDAQWALAEPLLPPQTGRGRPVEIDRRAVLNAIFYVLRTGCQWRFLPSDFPNHNTVYWYFARWIDAGVFARSNDELRRQLRLELGRDANPSAASIDSQSVKTTEKGGTAVMTRGRRSRDASDTFLLIRKAC